jgi:hypothetical protein
VRQYPRDDLWITVQGHLVIKTVFGERRKEIHGAALADIDRDVHPQLVAPKVARR